MKKFILGNERIKSQACLLIFERINKMSKTLLTLFLTISFTFTTASVGLCTTTNSYDKYGSKTCSYKQTSNGYNSYDKNCSKTGSYKQTSSGYTSYDKYGSKTGSYKTGSNGRTTSYDKYGNKVKSYK